MKHLLKNTALILTLAVLLTMLILPASAVTSTEFQQICDEAAEPVGTAIVYDLNSDTILYAKNPDKHISIASVTKVLNACTAAQYLSGDEQITVGREIYLISGEASTAPVDYGETYTFEQLLHALLLPSGCDVAYVFAAAAGRKAAGDASLSAEDAIDVFIDEMNRYLDKLGCQDSHFTTPDGQDEDGQYTTCRDYIRVLASAMRNDLIRSVVCKAAYSCYDADGGYHYWTTTNGMVNEDSGYYYPGTIGIKTGSTPWAGYCLALAVERNGRTLISLVTNANPLTVRYDVTEALMDAAFDFQPVRRMGDVDNDGQVTPADARLTLRASVFLESMDAYDFRYGDMDGDGFITPEDARRVLRVSIGLKPEE